MTKLFIIFVVLSLSFTVPACGQSSPPAAAKSGGNAREILIKALKAKLAAKSYRIKVEQVAASVGMRNTQEADYVAPDRLRATSEAGIGERSSKQEMIIIGQQAYARTPGGAWQKTQVDPQKLELARLRDHALIENLSKADDSFVKFSGGVEDGMQAFVYEQAVSAAPNISTRSKTTIWVGVADGLPHREELVADTDFKEEPARGSMRLTSTTTYYDYNADIKIEAPM